MTCHDCGEEVRGSDHWAEVVAWMNMRSRATVMKEQTGTVICSTCMVRRQAGAPLPERTLLDG